MAIALRVSPVLIVYTKGVGDGVSVGMGVEVSAIFIDVTGTGSGVVDVLTHAGYDPISVGFGNSPVFNPELYRYRSDELWGRLRERIKTDLILPSTPQHSPSMIGHNGGPEFDVENEGKSGTAGKLLGELTQREFGYTIKGNLIHLETKKDMKKRGVGSPDLADALALNFALDVAPPKQPHGQQAKGIMSDHDHDHLADVNVD